MGEPLKSLSQKVSLYILPASFGTFEKPERLILFQQKGVSAVQERLKIAFTEEALELFGTIPGRDTVIVKDSDFTDVGAIVMTDHDEGILDQPKVAAFGIPVFLIVTNPHGADQSVMG